MIKQKISLVLLLFLLLTSCAYTKLTHIPYTSSESIAKYLKPGDDVIVRSREGGETSLVITSIEPDRIVGVNQAVTINEIVSLQKKTNNSRKTLLINSVAIYSVLAIGLIIRAIF